MSARGWLALTSLLVASLAAAEPDPETAGHGPLVAGGGWRHVFEPKRELASRLAQRGRDLLDEARVPLASTVARRRASVRACARLRRALELDPALRDGYLLLARALTLVPGREEPERQAATSEAIAALERLRALDPAYEAEEVSFQLGSLCAQRGDLARARREYERALDAHSGDVSLTLLLGNMADLAMSGGELSRALALYDRALSEEPAGPHLLAAWGKAVALDRLGDRAAALREAAGALAAERSPFAALREEGVFFVPAHEVEYYEGLGYLALAMREAQGAETLPELLTRALRRAFSAPQAEELAELAAALREPALARLTARLAPLLERVSRVQGRLPPAREPSATRGVPEPSAARVVVWVLRSLGAFEAYVRADQERGPFAAQARAHVVELEQALRLP